MCESRAPLSELNEINNLTFRKIIDQPKDKTAKKKVQKERHYKTQRDEKRPP